MFGKLQFSRAIAWYEINIEKKLKPWYPKYCLSELKEINAIFTGQQLH